MLVGTPIPETDDGSSDKYPESRIILVLFLGLSALGDGNIATGWTEMMDHARSAMNVGADGHAYGANHMFHWTEADPMIKIGV